MLAFVFCYNGLTNGFPTFAGGGAGIMVRRKLLVMVLALGWSLVASSQCSICTKTASQLGKQSAEGLNGGIVYLMFVPFLIGGYIGYRWWKQEKANHS
jgi:hypothetical protein